MESQITREQLIEAILASGDLAISATAGILEQMLVSLNARRWEPPYLLDGIGYVPIHAAFSDDWWGFSYGDVLRTLAQFEDLNPDLVVLDIKSPGGVTFELGAICDALVKYGEKRKLAVFVGSYCTSSAYVLACAATSKSKMFFAAKDALLGSVGAFAGRPDDRKLNERIGREVHFFASHTKKLWGQPGVPLSKEEEAAIQARVDKEGAGLIERVVSYGRKDVDYWNKADGGLLVAGANPGLCDELMERAELHEYLLTTISKKRRSRMSTGNSKPALGDIRLEAKTGEIPDSSSNVAPPTAATSPTETQASAAAAGAYSTEDFRKLAAQVGALQAQVAIYEGKEKARINSEIEADITKAHASGLITEADIPYYRGICQAQGSSELIRRLRVPEQSFRPPALGAENSAGKKFTAPLSVEAQAKLADGDRLRYAVEWPETVSLSDD